MTSKSEKAREQLIESMESFCAGPGTRSERLVRLARAYSLVGRQPAATKAIERALALEAGGDEARTLELQRLRDRYLTLSGK